MQTKLNAPEDNKLALWDVRTFAWLFLNDMQTKVRGTIVTQPYNGQPRSVFVEYPRIDNKRVVCEIIKSADGKFTPIGQVHQFTNIDSTDEVNVAAVFLRDFAGALEQGVVKTGAGFSAKG